MQLAPLARELSSPYVGGMKTTLLVLVLLALCGRPVAAQVLDPDRCWTCSDSRQHFAGGAVLDVGLHVLPKHWVKGWGDTPVRRVAVVTIVGAIFEAGQYDAVRGTPNAGQRGYGFGLKDLGCDLLGAVAGELLTALWRKL